MKLSVRSKYYRNADKDASDSQERCRRQQRAAAITASTRVAARRHCSTNSVTQPQSVMRAAVDLLLMEQTIARNQLTFTG